jgi:hypothetical protein
MRRNSTFAARAAAHPRRSQTPHEVSPAAAQARAAAARAAGPGRRHACARAHGYSTLGLAPESPFTASGR